ncbi:unnamed protein product, partial [Chrysoparadoxa australica]
TFDTKSATLVTEKIRAQEVAGAIDFRGHTARNVALRNATIDGLDFLDVERMIVRGSALQAGAVTGQRIVSFDPKGELTHLPKSQLWVTDKGQLIASALEVGVLKAATLASDVDFGGYTAHNLTMTGVDYIDARELSVSTVK